MTMIYIRWYAIGRRGNAQMHMYMALYTSAVKI